MRRTAGKARGGARLARWREEVLLATATAIGTPVLPKGENEGVRSFNERSSGLQLGKSVNGK